MLVGLCVCFSVVLFVWCWLWDLRVDWLGAHYGGIVVLVLDFV